MFFEAKRYRLAAWVVMPNHVHVLFETWQTPLPKLLHSWKRHAALQINRLLGNTGPLWQEEYWDRRMRNEAHFNQAVHYIEWNLVKAGLATRPETWPFSSANARWRWTTGAGRTRYAGAHLIHPNWDRFGAWVPDPPGHPKP